MTSQRREPSSVVLIPSAVTVYSLLVLGSVSSVLRSVNMRIFKNKINEICFPSLKHFCCYFNNNVFFRLNVSYQLFLNATCSVLAHVGTSCVPYRGVISADLRQMWTRPNCRVALFVNTSGHHKYAVTCEIGQQKCRTDVVEDLYGSPVFNKQFQLYVCILKPGFH